MASVVENKHNKTTNGLTRDALKHSRDLLLALSRAAQSIQRARTAEEVYHAVVSQINSLGEDVSLFMFDEDCRSLRVAHTSYKPGLLRRIEKSLGASLIGYQIVFPPDSIFARSLDNGRTEYVRWTSEHIASALPPAFRPLAGQFMRLLKVTQGILAPLRTDNESLGLMIVDGSSLTENDVPAMESFAAQITISLQNLRLSRQMQSELSARKRVEETSLLQNTALEAAANAIAITDRGGIIQWVNPAWVRLTGYTKEESVGQSPRILKSAAHDRKFYKNMWDTILAGRVWRGELVNRHKDGSLYFEEETITPVLDRQGKVTHFIAIKLDITERKQAEAKLQRLARTDTLTGVYNRRHLFELAAHEFDVARRYQQPLAVIMFDLDHFKRINDTFGHAIGDRMLEEVTRAARSQLREVDLMGRYGGEEFLIVLPVTGAQQASLLAERIRAAVETLSVETDKGAVSVTLSIGIAEMFHAPSDNSVDDIIRRADEALYAAKKAGRNRTVIHDTNSTGMD